MSENRELKSEQLEKVVGARYEPHLVQCDICDTVFDCSAVDSYSDYKTVDGVLTCVKTYKCPVCNKFVTVH